MSETNLMIFCFQIERNSRKKLFPGDESGTATLKMEQPSPNNLNKVLPTVHKENEKEPKKHSFKQQMREMIEEKFQTKSANTDVERKDSNAAEGKKGHKFGIRVFPPSVNDKLFGRSPTKIQADNENNTNIEKKESDEKKEKSPSPPVVKKRTKEPKSIPDVIVVESATTNSTSVPVEFQRQGSLTSSGTMRNPAGIPQEVSGMMMQAANAAKDNRKSSNLDLDNKRKGKAPRPPQNENDLDGSTITMDTNLSMDMTDGTASRMLNGSMDIVPEAESDVKKFNLSDRMNFSDNFAEEVLNCTIESISGIDKFDDKGPSNSSTPKSERKKSSLTESMTHDEHGKLRIFGIFCRNSKFQTPISNTQLSTMHAYWRHPNFKLFNLTLFRLRYRGPGSTTPTDGQQDRAQLERHHRAPELAVSRRQQQ